MSNNISSLFKSLDNLERQNTNIPLIFSEILKDEINANDENTLYNNLKAILDKYKDNQPVLYVINLVIKALSDGATLEEILNVSIEEALTREKAEDITTNTNTDATYAM